MRSGWRLGSSGPMPAARSSSSTRASRSSPVLRLRWRLGGPPPVSSPFRRAADRLSSMARWRSSRTWVQLVAAPSPTTEPVGPSTRMKYGATGTPKSSHASLDMTVGIVGGASDRTVDSLSSSGPLVTATRRVSTPGRSSAAPVANASQNSRQVRHPLDRKASSVWCWTPVTARWTAPPAGVRPDRSAALPVVEAGPATPSRVVKSG